MADGTSADFAIVIGILYSELPKLEGTVADAEDFYNWLIEDAGIPNDNIEKLLSVSEQPGYPRQDDIDDAFLRLFEKAERLKAQRHGNPRRLYVYFAGHGAASRNDELCLMVANASSKNTLNRCLNTLSYHQWLQQQALFLEQLFFYDCCYLFDRRVEGRICPFTNSDTDPNPKTVQVVQHIFYASTFTQRAYERRPNSFSITKRGHFTKALIEGLRGEAIQKKSDLWMITTDSLREYISRRVANLATLYKDKQQPKHLGEKPIELLPARKPKLYEIGVNITTVIEFGYFLAIYDKNLSLFDKKFLTQQAELVLKLPSGVYTIRIEAEDRIIREGEPIDLLPSSRDRVSIQL